MSTQNKEEGLGLLKEVAVPAWAQLGTSQGLVFPSHRMGPTQLPHVQNDIVVRPPQQGKVSSRHTCQPLEHLDTHRIRGTEPAPEPAPGGPVVDSPFVFLPVIQRHF